MAKDIQYTIVLHAEGGVFCATVKEVPEVHTEGKTELEALKNAVAAIKDVKDAKAGKLAFK